MIIKNIIFDLGGVLLNIDYYKTIEAFKNLGIPNFEELFAQAKQEKLFDKYESGLIDSNEFVAGLKHKLSPTISEEQIKAAWSSMLLDFPNERLSFLKGLKEKYNTALLSNTNPIHLEVFHKIIKRNNDIESLDPFFDAVYFSSNMGMRKPSPEIFLEVCKQQGYEAAETLFIDDTERHVAGAKKAGLQALHLNVKEQDVIGLLNSILA